MLNKLQKSKLLKLKKKYAVLTRERNNYLTKFQELAYGLFNTDKDLSKDGIELSSHVREEMKSYYESKLDILREYLIAIEKKIAIIAEAIEEEKKRV